MTYTKKPILLLAGASLLMATACTDPGYVGGGGGGAPNNAQKTKTGALIGGLVGAGVGAAVSDKKGKGALIGGLAGAGIGAGIGYSLDKQEAELRQQLENEDIRITNTGDRLILTMPQDILFATDSARVNGGLRSDLLKVANSLQQYPQSTVQVVGHTDNTGAAAYNQDLSVRRANSVADVLLDGGVAFNRINAFGRGEDQPIASNLTEAGKAQNRRVEIVILPTS
ncbi:OmpA family protein [uncultured Roseovarius sp.]|uniref:OmpA family protein n=1 Tax=uncultured Roseovarius sp. TaxID=293344 RepID=UPI0026355179|nr:OmpA family protein [uncultured Roseovarius sp.]